jgi:hypothetical protein
MYYKNKLTYIPTKGVKTLNQKIADELEREHDELIKKLLLSIKGKEVTYVNIRPWEVEIQFSNNIFIDFSKISICKDFGEQITPYKEEGVS